MPVISLSESGARDAQEAAERQADNGFADGPDKMSGRARTGRATAGGELTPVTGIREPDGKLLPNHWET